MGAMELYLNAWRELTEDQADLLNGVASQAAIAIRHAPSLADGGRGTATAANADTGRMPGRRKLTR